MARPTPKMMFQTVLLALSTLKAIMHPARPIMMVDTMRATVIMPSVMVVSIFWNAPELFWSPMLLFIVLAANAVEISKRPRQMMEMATRYRTLVLEKCFMDYASFSYYRFVSMMAWPICESLAPLLYSFVSTRARRRFSAS